VRLKFKLTSWAGNKKAKELLALSDDELAAQNITAVNGTRINKIYVSGDGVGRLEEESSYQGVGRRWSFTTEDGIKVTFTRANITSTSAVPQSGPSAFHNLVEIQAPADATPEQLARAMQMAGVADTRPAVREDAQVLIENRLMSIFGKQTDANSNPSGESRAELLREISSRYGITPADVEVVAGTSGRVELRLSESGAQKIVELTKNPAALQHRLTVPGGTVSDEDYADWLVKVLSTPQEGLLSTTTRWSEGVGGSGMSSTTDVSTGGGDYVFTTPVSVMAEKTYGVNYGAVMFFDPSRVYRRLDFYANFYDNYGKRKSNQDILAAAKTGAYEVMFKHRMGWDGLDSIVVKNQAVRTMVIQKLRQMGITELGGLPLEQAIQIGSNVSV
jgi:hypothetical protein